MMTGCFDKMLQTQMTIKFKSNFKGDPRRLLRFLSDWNTFQKINGLTDPELSFQKLFGALSAGLRETYVSVTEDADLTCENLKAWLLAQYPPPFNKFYFIKVLKRIRIRQNENPKDVWLRFKIILAKIRKAINLINDTIADAAHHIQPLSDETLCDAMIHIFVRINCKQQNNGNINKLVKRYICKKDPKTFDDWKGIMENISKEIIPRVAETDYDYQYALYPPEPEKLDIYSEFYLNDPDLSGTMNWLPFDKRFRNQASLAHQFRYPINYQNERRRGRGRSRGRGRGRGRGNGSRGRGSFGGNGLGNGYNSYRGRGGYRGRGRRYGRGRGRGSFKRQYPSNWQYDGPNNKRHRQNQQFPTEENQERYCTRCHRTTHWKSKCRAINHVNGQKLNDAQSRVKCHRCHQYGHYQHQCGRQQPTNAQNQTKAAACRRCLRTDHLAQNCEWDTYANGDPIKTNSNKTLTAFDAISNDNNFNPPNNNHNRNNYNFETQQQRNYKTKTSKTLNSLYRNVQKTDHLTPTQKQNLVTALSTAHNVLNSQSARQREPF